MHSSSLNSSFAGARRFRTVQTHHRFIRSGRLSWALFRGRGRQRRAVAVERAARLARAYELFALSLAFVFLACVGFSSAQAATRTWTGGHASGGNWNLRENWDGVAVPTHGDTLVFPSGAARLFNTNNIPGLRLNAVQFTGPVGGYNLRGVGVTITNGITLIEGSSLTIHLPMVLGGNQAVHIPAGGSVTFFSDIDLNGFNLSLAAIGDVTMRGAISGNGNVSKSGVGELWLSGVKDNTFNGSLTIASGTLAMNRYETISVVPLTQESRIAVPGNLILGNGSGTVVATAYFDDQISNTGQVTVAASATLNLDGNDDAIGNLILSGGEITTGTGTLYLNGDVTAQASSTGSIISGQMALTHNTIFTVSNGTAFIDLDVSADILALTGIIKEGAGTLRLRGTNGYFGATTVNAGILRIGNDAALGPSNSGTVVNSGAELFLETGVDTLREPLTIAGTGIGGTGGAIRVGSPTTIATNIVLSAPATIVTLGGDLIINAVISGTGPLTKIGTGTLQLAGNTANTFFGEMRAEEGLLLLSKLSGNAVQGDLVIGSNGNGATARHTQNANLGGAVTVNAGSLYDLDGIVESIDSLTLNGGGDVQTGTGQLTVDGDVTVNAGLALSGSISTIDGRLGVGSGTRNIIVAETGGIGGDSADLVINARISGSANIIKSGSGDLSLTASNSFTGQLTVQDGELLVSDDHALGSTGANTVLTGDSIIHVAGDLTVDENLFLNTAGKPGVGALRNHGDNVWTGNIFLGQTTVVNVATNSELRISGLINGLAGPTKTGPGLLVYSGTAANTYIGATVVNEGTLRLERLGGANRAIPGALIVGDGVGGLEADVVEAVAPTQINNLAAVTINSSGVLRVLADDIIGSLSGSGRVQLLGGLVELQTGENNDPTSFDGAIYGSGSLHKIGTGTFTLTGTNSHTGDTLVSAGTLVVNGEQPDSDVYVGPAGTLSGIGTVGNLAVGGTFRPGNPRGKMDVASVNFLPNSILAVQLQNTPDFWLSPSHNWFRSYGAVDVTGASLDVSLAFAPVAGQTFILGNKTPVGPVTGTFSGRPEGSIIVLNDIPLRLSYTGDTGNDIVLTVSDLPLSIASTRIEAGNGNGRIDPDECNELFVTIQNTSGGAINGVTAHLDALDPRIAITQAKSYYGNIPALGSRTNRTAFQMRIASGYPCGSAVDLHLVIQSANHGPFALPVRLLAGTPGQVRTNQSTDTPLVIPDLGVVQSTIDWPDSFSVGQVLVKIHATHPAAGHLRFRLRNPWGDEVLLSANRGGNGDNYGINCARLTVFDQDAVTSIADAAANAPFEGTFAPEGSFNPFLNRHSGGFWTLTVEDTVAGGVGTLRCWSLELARAVCTDGGGGCESCTTRVTDSLSNASGTITERLTGATEASGCGNVNHCPGTTTDLGPYRYKTHSFTNDGPDTCVTVLALVPCGAWTNSLFFSTYLGDFNPADLCANYLGDVGQGVHGYYGEGSAFSFRVPAGERFTVVVAERMHLQGCSYSLELFGLPCPQEQPRLHIANDAGPDHVRLHWSTAYPGFQLQGKPSLGGPGIASPAYTNVTTTPTVHGGHYSVTNSAGGRSGFFRLRKP